MVRVHWAASIDTPRSRATSRTIGLPSPATTAPVSAAKARAATRPRGAGAGAWVSARRVSVLGRPSLRAAPGRSRWPSRRPRTWSAGRSGSVAAHPVQRRHQARAGRPEWVAKGDRAALQVGPVEVGTGLGRPGQDDGGERLVDLERPDLVERQSGTAQRGLRGRDRASEHDNRVGTDHGHRVDAGQRPKTVAAHGLRGRDEDRRRPVRDLAGQGSSQPPALADRCQRGQVLGTRSPSWSLVVVEVNHQDGLLDEQTRVVRGQRASMALEGELLHRGPAEVPLLGDELGAPELIDGLVAEAPAPAFAAARVRHPVLEADRRRRRDRDLAHHLDATGDHEVLHARHHRLGGEVDGLLGRAALPVHRRTRDSFRKTGREGRGPADVGRLRPHLADAAPHDVVDRGWVGATARQQRLDDRRAEVGRMDGREGATALADRRADGVDEICPQPSPSTHAGGRFSRKAPAPSGSSSPRKNARLNSWAASSA